MIGRLFVAALLFVGLMSIAWLSSLSWECHDQQHWAEQHAPNHPIEKGDICQRVPALLSALTEAPGLLLDWLFEIGERHDKAIVALGTAVIAVFTGILGIATGLLWRSTRGLVKGAEETAERQLRAYVLVEACHLSKDPQADGNFGVIVHSKNFGTTPASDLLEWARVHVGPFPLDGDLPPPGVRTPSRTVLAPSGKSLMIPTHPRIHELQTRAIADEHTAIYVYGEFHYTDAFEKVRHTYFRQMCIGQGIALGLFRACEEGNSYT